jgi:hypothetical protein
VDDSSGEIKCHDCGKDPDFGYHLSAWWCSVCHNKRLNPASFLTVDKLLKIKEDFEKNFPRRDHVRETAIFANWFHQQYGFKIIPKCIPDDAIAVSPAVYSALMGFSGG